MVDVYVLLLIAGAGDSLQGIKRGVLELVDLLLINKADGGGEGAAEAAAKEYALALRLMRGPEEAPPVLTCSALEGAGIDAAWGVVVERMQYLREGGGFEAQRSAQRVQWMWREVERGFKVALRGSAPLREEAQRFEVLVSEGEISPGVAAMKLLQALWSARKG